MPPRRSKAKAAAVVTPEEGTARPPSTAKVNAVKPELFESRERVGLLIFPTETIRQIISYIPAIDLPTSEGCSFHQEYPSYDPSIEAYGEVRSDVLRKLSQTCRPFRKFFLPLLWERVDVYAKGGGEVWYKRVSKKLETMSLQLAHKNNKELAGFVRSIHVVLTRCSTSTVLPAFAKCLQALTNLHTLEIIHAHSQMTTALKEAFEGIQLPSIKMAILPSCAHNILRCCPEVISVICTEDDGSKLLGAIATSCKKVEVIERFMPNVPMLKRMVKNVPNLKSLTVIRLIGNNDADDIRVLKPLKSLSEIKFCLEPYFAVREEWKDSEDPMAERAKQYPIVEGAKDVLKEGSHGRKRLVALYHWYERPPKQMRSAIWHEREVEIPIE